MSSVGVCSATDTSCGSAGELSGGPTLHWTLRRALPSHSKQTACLLRPHSLGLGQPRNFERLEGPLEFAAERTIVYSYVVRSSPSKTNTPPGSLIKRPPRDSRRNGCDRDAEAGRPCAQGARLPRSSPQRHGRNILDLNSFEDLSK